MYKKLKYKPVCYVCTKHLSEFDQNYYSLLLKVCEFRLNGDYAYLNDLISEESVFDHIKRLELIGYLISTEISKYDYIIYPSVRLDTYYNMFCWCRKFKKECK